ncbi:MAG: hypothetical protein AAGA85_15455 [Bacteroidota bacterium]
MEEMLAQLKGRDSALDGIIERIAFPQIKNTHDVFEDLSSCILDMRIHYAPSRAAFRYPRLKQLIKGARITPDLILRMPDEVLLPLKLSQQKHESLRLWATKWKDEALAELDWFSMTDAEVAKTLDGIKGMSSWTTQVILLFTLERPDIFPVGDYQLKKAFSEVYHLEENKALVPKMTKIAEAWRPYRSLGCRYLWKWRSSGVAL